MLTEASRATLKYLRDNTHGDMEVELRRHKFWRNTEEEFADALVRVIDVAKREYNQSAPSHARISFAQIGIGDLKPYVIGDYSDGMGIAFNVHDRFVGVPMLVNEDLNNWFRVIALRNMLNKKHYDIQASPEGVSETYQAPHDFLRVIGRIVKNI